MSLGVARLALNRVTFLKVFCFRIRVGSDGELQRWKLFHTIPGSTPWLFSPGLCDPFAISRHYFLQAPWPCYLQHFTYDPKIMDLQSTWDQGLTKEYSLELVAIQNYILWIAPCLVILKQSLSRCCCNVISFVNPSVFLSVPHLAIISSWNQIVYFFIPFWPQWGFPPPLSYQLPVLLVILSIPIS